VSATWYPPDTRNIAYNVLVPVVLVMRVLPTLRLAKTPGALMSYHSFFRKGSVLHNTRRQHAAIRRLPHGSVYSTPSTLQGSPGYPLSHPSARSSCHLHLLLATLTALGDLLLVLACKRATETRSGQGPLRPVLQCKTEGLTYQQPSFQRLGEPAIAAYNIITVSMTGTQDGRRPTWPGISRSRSTILFHGSPRHFRGTRVA
jgi:hypothetical protein